MRQRGEQELLNCHEGGTPMRKGHLADMFIR